MPLFQIHQSCEARLVGHFIYLLVFICLLIPRLLCGPVYGHGEEVMGGKLIPLLILDLARWEWEWGGEERETRFLICYKSWSLLLLRG